MKIVFSEDCLQYSQAGHPESPERVRETYNFLKDRFEIVPPGRIEEADILRVHSQSLLDSVKGGDFFDADSPAYPNIYVHAMRAAAGAVAACELALAGETAISLLRPPGHHAGKDFLGGFCYFNNIAIAVARALPQVRRAAIIDFDCHHGNGTQDIFMGSPDVLYVSLHQSPLYPGTGHESIDNCRNFPLPAGTVEPAYLAVFKRALDEVRQFDPGLIAVSAGFDTYRGDPLTDMQLEIETYRKIGRAIRKLDQPTFAVLEGGYSSDLPQCAAAFLKGMV
ncbi:MAG: histone deacetylase [bacterium]